ncbi:FtsX-like permease family protein [Lactobacillus sp. ESL0679]|uniref:ABC transporter permease n=1 Tax=Lactobacillus sp. ESL0679 TaxID=2983209 RepID=UPI0023F69114|nr:ABC transporter permease [Lactobacillus sp. ESL0679]MDF7682202.1 FtsX-like permease family protein [Lactobacillus sp. ESL0679]
MKYLNRKLFRDIKENWTQFFSVFLMAMLSVIVFVGLQGAWHGLQKSLDEFTNQASLPNYWVQSSTITNPDLEKVKSLSKVSNVERGTRFQVKQSGRQLIVDVYQHPMSHFYIVKGNRYDNQSIRGIWINKEYAQNHNLAINDDLRLTINNQSKNFKIKGIVQSPEHIYFTGTQEFIAPNYSNYGYAYISPKALTEYLSYHAPYNIMEIKGNKNNMRRNIERIFSDRLIGFYSRKTLPDVSNALDRVGQIRNLSYLFSFIFILLATLAMYTTIQRLIKNQTDIIATFKALGLSNLKVRLHYASFGLLVGGLGTITGFLFAPAISWFVLVTQQQMFSIPHWKISFTYSSVLVVIGVIVICILAAFEAARNATSGLPALFLRGKEENSAHKILLEHWRLLWSHLSYESKWALRDIFINRVRTLMGIVGVAGGMMLMIAGLGMPQSMHHLVDKAYTHDFTYDRRLIVKDSAKYKKANPHAQQWVQLSQAHFTPDDGYDRTLVVLGTGSEVDTTTTTGNKIKNGGIYVTNGFAKKAHLKVGDKVKIRTFAYNKSHKFKIKGIITSETNQGAYITKKTWTKYGGTFNPSTLLVTKHYKYKKSDINSIISIKDQHKNATDFVENLISIFILIIVFGILLIIIVLYNLGSLSFVERTRDYATLRVLGTTQKEIRKLTIFENIITTFVGWIIGIPAGIWFLGKYVNTFSTINLEYVRYFDWKTILVSTIIVWLASLSTTLFISHRIKRINMVSSLKSVE